jgi:hypothetical protein
MDIPFSLCKIVRSSVILLLPLFINDEISLSENSNIFNKVRAYIRQTKILDKKLSQLMDCPLPTNNTHIIMSIQIAHTQI